MDIKEKIYKTVVEFTDFRVISNNDSIKIVDELECYVVNDSRYSLAIDINDNLYCICRDVVFGKQRTSIFRLFANVKELMEFSNKEEE